jgi:hypothetical protein
MCDQVCGRIAQGEVLADEECLDWTPDEDDGHLPGRGPALED